MVSYDGSFMGVLDDLVNFVSSFLEFYKSTYAIAPKCSNFDKIVSSCARTPRAATAMTFLKYGHPPVVSTHERARRSLLFSCSRNVIHYCIEILPLRTCTYVVKYYY